MQTQEMEMKEEARLQEANEGDTVQINKAALHKLLECLLKQKEDTAQENAILKMELKAYKEKFAESLAVLKKVSEELEKLKKDIVPENARLKIELEAYKEKFAESLAMTKMVSEELDSRNHDTLHYKTKLEDVAKELHSTENILMSREKEIQILKSQVAEQLKTEMKSEIPSTKEDGYEKWKPKKGYTLKQYKLKMDKEKSRKAEIEKLTAVSIAVAQKLHESEKIRESLQIKLKLEKEKVFILSKELDEIKEDEKTRKELKIREEKIGYELDIISG